MYLLRAQKKPGKNIETNILKIFQTKMEEKYLSVLGGPARLEARAGQAPSQAQVLAWVDEVFHDLRQNKVSSGRGLSRITNLPQPQS